MKLARTSIFSREERVGSDGRVKHQKTKQHPIARNPFSVSSNVRVRPTVVFEIRLSFSMVLREKAIRAPAWRSFTSRRDSSDNSSFLTPSRRGAFYIALFLFVIWAIVGRNSSESSFSSGSVTSKLKQTAYGLGGNLDPEIFGPPIQKRGQRPLQTTVSTLTPLTLWNDGVPETTVHGLNGGTVPSLSSILTRP